MNRKAFDVLVLFAAIAAFCVALWAQDGTQALAWFACLVAQVRVIALEVYK